jgi:hypothetical protein
MAHITLAGVLLDPTGEFSVGDRVKFTHQSTTGNTMRTAVSEIIVPPNGAYSIDLEYGLVLVEYNDYRLGQYRNLGIATVNATNTATSIPELLNAVVPASSAELIEFQSILSDCAAALKQTTDVSKALSTGVVVFQTYAILTAFSPAIDQQMASFKVVNDPSSSLNGYYAWVSGTTYIKDANLANGIVSSGNSDATSGNTVHDHLKLGQPFLNGGSVSPQFQKVRDGVTSAEKTSFSNVILAASVQGASEDEYYLISYFQNGSTLGSFSRYDWRIIACKRENFETASVSEILIDFSTTGPTTQPQADPSGGVQTLTFKPAQRPEITIDLTVDMSSAPAGAIVSINPSDAGYSYIIGEENYTYTKGDIGTVNPPQALVRDSVTSSRSDFWDAIENVKVRGANPDKYYRIAYFKNGSTALGATNLDGWVFEECDKATFATADEKVTIQNYNDTAPDIPRDGKVHTVEITCANSPLIKFSITINTAKLRTYGTIYPMNITTNPSYSWIIDPRNYFTASEGQTKDSGRLYVAPTVDGGFTVAWAGSDKLYRVRISPHGYNNIVNVAEVAYSNDTNLSAASWAVAVTGSTDWLPPLTVSADNSGDGGGQIFTGGNHGSSGGASGASTGFTERFSVLIDGRLVNVSTLTATYCEQVNAVITNKICAYNTITFPRYAVRQTFNLNITPAVVRVSCEVAALEDCTFKIDYGCQMLTSAADTILILDSQYSARQSYSNGLVSGVKSSYPDAWLATVSKSTLQQTTYMDNTYEYGDLRAVPASESLIITLSDKVYHKVIFQDTPISAGNKYKWRGGYGFDGSTAPTGTDSFIQVYTGEFKNITIFTPDDYVDLSN